jgi:hypothetical protein
LSYFHYFGAGTKYGIPMPEDCKDGVDNDFDGKADCADSDCGEASGCGAGTEYGIPLTEVCDDGTDNDGDGMKDCTDPDCKSLPGCAGTKYGAPY